MRSRGNMRPIKYDAIQNDMRLMEMALYEITKGQTQNASQDLIVKKLSEYKRIIKRGTYTLDQLEDKIFSRFGLLNKRSKTDTAIYDASLDAQTSPLDSFFSGFFRKSQGLDGKPTTGLGGFDELDGLEEYDGLDDLDNLDDLDLSLEDLTPPDPDNIDEKPMKELDDKFSKDQLDNDFPDNSEEPEKPEDEDDVDPIDPDDNLPF